MPQDKLHITVNIDLKRKTIRHGNWKGELTNHIKIPLTLDDLLKPVDEYDSEYDRLSHKLDLLCKLYSVDHKRLQRMVASTPVVRLKTMSAYMQIPMYVAQKVFDIIREHDTAMVSYQSGLRKTSEYTEYLRGHVRITTAKSTEQLEKAEQIYHLPKEFDAPDALENMSVEMLAEELRVAEEKNAKPAIMDKLRKYFHAAQKVERETKHKGKPMNEFEQAMAATRAEKEESERDRPKRRKHAK